MMKESMQYLLSLLMITFIIICGCTRIDDAGETSIGIIGPPEGLTSIIGDVFLSSLGN